jgi:hypothetical protein
LLYKIYWTDRQIFLIRFKEHFHVFKHADGKTKFAQHLLDYGHFIGPIEDMAKILHVVNKGGLKNIIESFHL